MSSFLKIVQPKKIIIIREVGELSNEKVDAIITKGIAACQIKPDYHLVVDLRETTWSSDVEVIDILKIAMEIYRVSISRTTKIAAIVPDDRDRLVVSKKFEAAIQLKGIPYRIFTDMAAAEHWLGPFQTAS